MNKPFLKSRWLLLAFIFLSTASLAQNTNSVPKEHIIMLNPQTPLTEFLQKIPSDLTVRVKETLSSRLNIHLVEIQTSQGISSTDIQKKLDLLPDLYLSQQNHYVVHRKRAALIPNDTLFQRQWNLNNTGQQGGTEDADIDAPEAWDITTGGISIHNDPIVIAVIDEGFDLSHPDVPWWVNRSEIPNNNIDDDQNGYIDDIQGWNTVSDNGDIIPKLHGTHVSGIAAASGNNQLGVSGVTWNTQVLPVVGFNLDDNGFNTEALVIAAYAYVYEMRLLYNETRGQRGAFIVATNTSFGLERGRPENSPIWCAMYDSLGTLGILNAVATTNATRNVDLEGDIPSNCPSDYLLVATQTNRNDLKIGGSFQGGIGPINVDIAAPGEEILSTGLNGEYTLLSGTSMAAPHVAGVVALTYAALCNNILASYKNTPSEVAQIIRRIILDTVDPIDTLQNEIASGGRLNAYQALLAVDSLCQTVPNNCGLTYYLQSNSITDTSAVLSWQLINEATSYSLRYRKLSDSTWNTLTTLNNEISLDGLTRCTTYEFQVSTICANAISEFTSSTLFTTEGCCEPPSEIRVDNLEEGISQIHWNSIFGSDIFEIDLRVLGEDQWSTLTTSNTVLLLDTLGSCVEYELRIRTICDTLIGEYSDIFTFRTLDCGLCVEGDYCEIQGENIISVNGIEWIDRIKIGPLENASGNNEGYGSFLFDEQPVLTAGIPYAIELSPGFSQDEFEEYWLIWIDLNRNGTFDEPEEIVFDPGGTSAQPILDTMIIPFDIEEGDTRLRIAMQFQSPPPVCGSFLNGEAEDYCIVLQIDSTLCLPPNDWEVVETEEQNASIEIRSSFNAQEYLARFKPLDSDIWQTETFSARESTFSLISLIPCTGYDIQIATICEGDTSAFSSSQRFLTKGCGACTDITYCEVEGLSSRDEWIEEVEIGERTFTSGNNDGYGDLRFAQITLNPSRSYPFTLRPGFNVEPFAEHWSIWIDWNQNGDFADQGEQVFSTSSPTIRPVSDTLAIPENALLGTTRMRIAMQFGDSPITCQDVEFGEIEDYCIQITNLTSNDVLINERVNIYPNPFTDVLKIDVKDRIDKITISDVLGNVVFRAFPAIQGPTDIPTMLWPAGTYIIKVNTSAGVVIKKGVKY